MKTILKNNWHHLCQQKQLIILQLSFTIIAIVAALWLPSLKPQATIASTLKDYKDESSRIVYVDDIPTDTDLITAKYDAYVTEEDGEIVYRSIQSMANKVTDEKTNIESVIGFLSMFILLLSTMMMYLFDDERKTGQAKRILSTSMSTTTYLLGHFIFNLLFLYLPTWLIVMIASTIMKVDFELSLLTFSAILFLLCLFACSFSLVLYTVSENKDDSAKMSGNIIILLTSLLSGSFYNFSFKYQWLNSLIDYLPQKALFNLTSSLLDNQSIIFPVIYLSGLIIVFVFISITHTSKKLTSLH